MKKTLILFPVFCSLIMLGLSSCSKDGAAGPAGATGATGATGPAGAAQTTDSIFVTQGQWTSIGGGTYQYTYTDKHITQAVLTSGSVVVADWNAAEPGWFEWPDVVAGGAGLRYFYSLNSITFEGDNFSSAPTSMSIKIVITQ